MRRIAAPDAGAPTTHAGDAVQGAPSQSRRACGWAASRRCPHAAHANVLPPPPPYRRGGRAAASTHGTGGGARRLWEWEDNDLGVARPRRRADAALGLCSAGWRSAAIGRAFDRSRSSSRDRRSSSPPTPAPTRSPRTSHGLAGSMHTRRRAGARPPTSLRSASAPVSPGRASYASALCSGGFDGALRRHRRQAALYLRMDSYFRAARTRSARGPSHVCFGLKDVDAGAHWSAGPSLRSQFVVAKRVHSLRGELAVPPAKTARSRPSARLRTASCALRGPHAVHLRPRVLSRRWGVEPTRPAAP